MVSLVPPNGPALWCHPSEEVQARSLSRLTKGSAMAHVVGGAVGIRTRLEEQQSSVACLAPRRQTSDADPEAALATELP